jgi:hypothetical protein
MAEPSFLQRGLTGFRDTLRTAGRNIGEASKRAAKKAKASLGNIKKAFGYSDVDAFNDDVDQQQRRKQARQLIGSDEPDFVGVPQRDQNRDLATLSPEFRAQVSSGLAAANSQTTGSTTVNAGERPGKNHRY